MDKETKQLSVYFWTIKHTHSLHCITEFGFRPSNLVVSHSKEKKRKEEKRQTKNSLACQTADGCGKSYKSQ
ncbi:hypothetical protein I7I48_04438 [Histoplasma ohiense]|nr:hypothetical protein I7I48_04438 [Histoplasma ohiense (nom. inval.)]